MTNFWVWQVCLWKCVQYLDVKAGYGSSSGRAVSVFMVLFAPLNIYEHSFHASSMGCRVTDQEVFPHWAYSTQNIFPLNSLFMGPLSGKQGLSPYATDRKEAAVSGCLYNSDFCRQRPSSPHFTVYIAVNGRSCHNMPSRWWDKLS